MLKLKDGIFRQIKQHKIGLACFAFLVLYEWLIVNNGVAWIVNPVLYSLYVIDYSVGFCSRILPGAVYGFLVGKYEVAPVTVFVTVFFLLLLAALAFFSSRFFAAAAPDEKKTCLALLFIFLTGPFSFGIFAREFGMLDLYWVLFFAVGLLLLQKKRLKWLLPLCFAGMGTVNFASIFCYAAVLLLLIFFFAAKAEERAEKRQYYILFSLCFFVTVVTSVYFVQFEGGNLVYPVEEFNRMLRERGVIYPEYLDSTLYRITDESIVTPTYDHGRFTVDPDSKGLARFMQWIWLAVWAAFSFPKPYPRLLFLFLLEVPSVALFIVLLLSYWSANRGRREKRFVSVLMILLFFGTTAVGFLFSSDNVRWIAHAFIGLCICTFCVFYFDYREGFRKARSILRRVGLPLFAVYALIYALVTMDPFQ